jgi:hypothetical protein
MQMDEISSLNAFWIMFHGLHAYLRLFRLNTFQYLRFNSKVFGTQEMKTETRNQDQFQFIFHMICADNDHSKFASLSAPLSLSS